MKSPAHLTMFATAISIAFSPAGVSAQGPPLGDCWECRESVFLSSAGNTLCMGGSYMGLSDCMQIGDQDHHHCATYGSFCLVQWDAAQAIHPVGVGDSQPVTLGYLALQDETWVIRKCGNEAGAPLPASPKGGGGDLDRPAPGVRMTIASGVPGGYAANSGS